MKIYYVVNKYTGRLMGGLAAKSKEVALALARARHGFYCTVEEATL